MNPYYPATAERAGHRCEYCRAPEVMNNFPFEVDHVIPGSRGGGSEHWNLALGCRSCNLFKGDCISELDEPTMQSTRLFHPRIDDWDDHFAFDGESGELRGLTPMGRVTAIRLHLNSQHQIAARIAWHELGFYPPERDG